MSVFEGSFWALQKTIFRIFSTQWIQNILKIKDFNKTLIFGNFEFEFPALFSDLFLVVILEQKWYEKLSILVDSDGFFD